MSSLNFCGNGGDCDGYDSRGGGGGGNGYESHGGSGGEDDNLLFSQKLLKKRRGPGIAALEEIRKMELQRSLDFKSLSLKLPIFHGSGSSGGRKNTNVHENGCQEFTYPYSLIRRSSPYVLPPCNSFNLLTQSPAATKTVGPLFGSELPSNQNPYLHYNSVVLPQVNRKEIGTKRSHPISMESHQVPSFGHQFPSTCNKIDTSNPFAASESRGLKQNNTLEPSFKRYRTDYGGAAKLPAVRPVNERPSGGMGLPEGRMGTLRALLKNDNFEETESGIDVELKLGPPGIDLELKL